MFKSLKKQYKNDIHKKAVGDIEVCLDNKKNPVIIPLVDRFLHTLVVGPAGCGKPFLTFIPMIYQDMKNEECGITIIDDKGNISDKAYAIAKHLNREALYFNPLTPKCPKFNPMIGEEIDVVANLTFAFRETIKDRSNYILDLNEMLLTYGIRVLKRLFGNNTSLCELSNLINNIDNYGVDMINHYQNSYSRNLPEEQLEESERIVKWFTNIYFREDSPVYEDCKDVREGLDMLISNKHLKDILSLSNEDNREVLDFDNHLKNGDVVIINTSSEGLDSVGNLFKLMIMLKYQSSVYYRRDREDIANLKPNFLYIDKFHNFCNSSFLFVLTMGRVYGVACHLGIHSRNEIPSKYRDTILSNIRNTIIYPAIGIMDAEYYSSMFNSISKSDTFTTIDLIYKEFGKLTYATCMKNSFICPSEGKVMPIPKDINNELDKIIEQLHK